MQLDFKGYSSIFVQENAFESIVCEIAAILSGGDELRTYLNNNLLNM